MLTQRRFDKEARQQAVIWIDPSKIKTYAGSSSSNWPVTHDRLERANALLPSGLVGLVRPAFRMFEPVLTPPHQFKKTGPISGTTKFKLAEDFIANQDHPQNSIWFKKLATQLHKTGVARHKSIKMKSTSDIVHFFETYVQPMVTSLERDGFLASHTGYESAAVVDADGTLIKSGSGNHRFCICKVLGNSRFPLKIVGMHADFFFTHYPSETVTSQAILKLLKPLEARFR